MLPEYRPNWYTFADLVAVTRESPRNLRRRLSGLSPSLARPDPAHAGPGRPPIIYHYMADPRLTAHHQHQLAPPAPPPAPDTTPDTDPIAPDDLARAKLRLTAIQECLARRAHMPAADADAQTLADWQRRPRTEHVEWTERLPKGHTRKHRRTIGITISERSLRRWLSIYKEEESRGPSAQLAALSLSAKRQPAAGTGRGRKAAPIPDELLQFVYGLSASTARADVAKAVAHARAHWPADDWPAVSIDTWRRRILALDPRKFARDLSHSIQRFRANHSGDIEIDWNALGYNQLWIVDDVQEDWYAHGVLPARLMRPYAYAIMRAATRQWVALYVSEYNITHDQTRELVGFALATPQGGIPEIIKWEHGNIACPPGSDLDQLLIALGVRNERTMQHSGHVAPGAFPDPGNGNPQGKAPHERSMRAHHELQAYAPAQVGTAERDTAPARLEAMLKESQRLRDEGAPGLLIPGPTQWPIIVRDTVEAYNDRPHQGLPQMLDPESGKIRHLSPNEMARQLRAQSVTLMDERLLPLFTARGLEVDVSRNGVLINKLSYGRHDPDLQQHRRVRVFVSDTHPDAAYVYELGRCIERYRKVEYGDTSEIERKRANERAKRSQWEAAVAELLKQPNATLPGSVSATRNPVPERPAVTIAPDPLLARASAYRDGLACFRADQAAADARFEPAATAAPAARSGRGLLARAADLESQVAALSIHTPTQESSW
ncbi:MAG: hypothetical protein ABIL09_16760 [Gemmatimonadota bacterium]